MKEPHSLPPPPPNHHSLSPPAPLFQQKRLAEWVSVVWAYGKLEDPPLLSSAEGCFAYRWASVYLLNIEL